MALVEKAAEAGRMFASLFGIKKRSEPIDGVTALENFVATRSAFVGQKKLYGYLKTRMGTRYPTMFEDDTFIASINVAKAHIYAACLSDLTVFAVADIGGHGRLSEGEKAGLADRCYRYGLSENQEQLLAADAGDDWLAQFAARCRELHWENVAAGGQVFDRSPPALFEWAPIAPQLKVHDRETVENSIKFAWIEVRRDYRRMVDRQAVANDWRDG